MFSNAKNRIVTAATALPGRDQAVTGLERHAVTGVAITPPFPEGAARAMFAMGCFWGAERRLWEIDGVLTTAVGYAGGYTKNPLYDEVCSGRTGHTEAVLAVFDPKAVAYGDLLAAFWEAHDPTQGMRQGNDVGTMYRSAIFVYDDDQRAAAEDTRARYQARLVDSGYGPITTEIVGAREFYYAESVHQQYLAKNPNGYCGLGGTGVSCAWTPAAAQRGSG